VKTAALTLIFVSTFSNLSSFFIFSCFLSTSQRNAFMSLKTYLNHPTYSSRLRFCLNAVPLSSICFEADNCNQLNQCMSYSCHSTKLTRSEHVHVIMVDFTHQRQSFVVWFLTCFGVHVRLLHKCGANIAPFFSWTSFREYQFNSPQGSKYTFKHKQGESKEKN